MCKQKRSAHLGCLIWNQQIGFDPGCARPEILTLGRSIQGNQECINIHFREARYRNICDRTVTETVIGSGEIIFIHAAYDNPICISNDTFSCRKGHRWLKETRTMIKIARPWFKQRMMIWRIKKAIILLVVDIQVQSIYLQEGRYEI